MNMSLLTVTLPNGDVKYFGPFPTEARAIQYGHIAANVFSDAVKPAKWRVVPLIVPYGIVRTILWRDSDSTVDL